MSGSRQRATPDTRRTPPSCRPHGSATWRTRAAGAFGLAGLLLTASCSTSHSNSQLAKIGRSIPVPAGFTYVNEFDHVNRGDFGDNQNEVDINYSNSTMSCDQVAAAWLAVLQKTYHNIQGAGFVTMYIHSHGVLVAIEADGIAGTSECSSPRVAVGSGVS